MFKLCIGLQLLHFPICIPPKDSTACWEDENLIAEEMPPEKRYIAWLFSQQQINGKAGRLGVEIVKVAAMQVMAVGTL